MHAYILYIQVDSTKSTELIQYISNPPSLTNGVQLKTIYHYKLLEKNISLVYSIHDGLHNTIYREYFHENDLRRYFSRRRYVHQVIQYDIDIAKYDRILEFLKMLELEFWIKLWKCFDSIMNSNLLANFGA